MKLRPIHKKLLAFFLLCFMAGFNIQTGYVQASAVCLSSPSADNPLAAMSSRHFISQCQNDFSTSEILGIKKASVLLSYHRRLSEKSFYRHTCVPFLWEYCINWFTEHKTDIKQSQTIETDSKSSIIRYIHNQDGEKGSSFLYYEK